MARSRKDLPPNEIRRQLVKTRIAPDLLAAMSEKRPTKRKVIEPARPERYAVIIEFNRGFPGGISAARERLLSDYWAARIDQQENSVNSTISRALRALLESIPRLAEGGLERTFCPDDELDIGKSMWTEIYVFGRLSRETIDELVAWRLPGAPKPTPLIYKIWRDHDVSRFITESIRTVKCDAARASFFASGRGVVWAIADTGIDGSHPHFHTYGTLDLPDGLSHHDFTSSTSVPAAAPGGNCPEPALTDDDGHGTHVAGIIAGFTSRQQRSATGDIEVDKIVITTERLDKGQPVAETVDYMSPICGMAPECKLLSLKVLQSGSRGELSNVLAAIGFIQQANDNGRNLRIHGLNLSLGYSFDPEWFAAGQSPLCVEVDRLVRSGVCVVVAAGNGGYGQVNASGGRTERAAHLGTIADPGNALLAITVGSAHRDMPHTYGVSYFSAKGPTSDGRQKPDLVAPGERIISCARMDDAHRAAKAAPFRSDSGTSMATPHVSGAIAAFLSVRGEFKGRPEAIKEIFMNSATDLKRRSEFQGAGLVDVMRALQSV